MRQSLKGAFRRFGLDVRRYRPRLAGPEGPAYPVRRALIIAEREINLVFDVGANEGQYGEELRANGYQGRIVSFEPVSDSFRKLEHRARRDHRWEAHKFALSDVEGEVLVRVGADSAWSSVLALGEAGAPMTFVGSEIADARRLDTVARSIMNTDDRLLLKIDVQGLELNVLRGAEALIDRTHVIETELAIRPMYEGQPLYRDVLDYLENCGFELAVVDSGYMEGNTGCTSYIDAILVPTRGATASYGS
jgi:FkbM family methyltransferase